MKIGLALAGGLVLATWGSGVSAQQTLHVPSYRPAVDGALTFPDTAHAKMRGGTFVNSQTLALVVPGLSKKQVYPLLGVPHFNEGLFGVRRWNYVFHFYTGAGDAQITCQYQIRFDRRSRVEGTWFREQQCADLLNKALAR